MSWYHVSAQHRHLFASGSYNTVHADYKNVQKQSPPISASKIQESHQAGPCRQGQGTSHTKMYLQGTTWCSTVVPGGLALSLSEPEFQESKKQEVQWFKLGLGNKNVWICILALLIFSCITVVK